MGARGFRRKQRATAEVTGSAGRQVAKSAKRLGHAVAPGVDQSPAHDALERVQPKLQLRGDAEVATAAAQAPKEIPVLLVACDDDGPVRGHDLGSDEVVAGEPVLGREVADAAAEREPRHPSRADDATGRDEAEGLRRGVEVQPGRASLDAGDPRVAVDVDPSHEREVDHEPAVADAVSGRIVSTPAHGDLESLGLGEVEGRRHITGVEAPRDRRWAPIDQGVETPARLLVAGIRRPDHGARQGATKLLERLLRRWNRFGHLRHPMP